MNDDNQRKVRKKHKKWSYQDRLAVARGDEKRIAEMEKQGLHSRQAIKRRIKKNELKALLMVQKIREHYKAGATVAELDRAFTMRTDSICSNFIYYDDTYCPHT